MSVVINTNVDSLKIQSILTNSTNKLSQSMQRMSSGLKINSAKDDAAGTVISARMSAQLDGNKICQNNVQNANSLLETAEGNIDVVFDNITRIRDLTLEAKNGTYSKEEIQAMQDEVNQRIAEIDRISQSSKFSQLQLFGDTSAAGLASVGAHFQVGANSDQHNVIDAASSLFDSVKFQDIVVKAGAGTTVTSVANFQSALNQQGVNAAATQANNGKVYYNTDTGTFNIVRAKDDGSGYEAVEYEGKTEFAAVASDPASPTAGQIWRNTTTGEYKISDGTNTTVLSGYRGGDYTANDTAIYAGNTFDLTNMVAGTGSGSFGEALDALDSAIDNLTNRKSLIGSLGNRLDSAYDTLTTQYTNLSSAKSIITDADIASEASNFTQQQILQQVSVSLLTQANQAPQLALSLL